MLVNLKVAMTQIDTNRHLELFLLDLETTQGQFRVISKRTVMQSTFKMQPYFVDPTPIYRSEPLEVVPAVPAAGDGRHELGCEARAGWHKPHAFS